MNDSRPTWGREESPGGSTPKRTRTIGAFANDLELVPRLQAIVDELDLLDADVDVPRTLAIGLLEDIEAAL